MLTIFLKLTGVYEDIATGKLQIRRLQRPHPGVKTLTARNAFEYLQTTYIAKN